LDGAVTLPHPQEHPEEGVLRNQLAKLTQRAMAALTREHQEILRLVFYEEQPYEEISTLLGIPANTVKTRVYYAKQRLKEQLARLGEKETIR
jgi:RNA polymerase sigma-70 factor (ECF subfamily)